jgi:hypothetical protein
MMIKLTVAFCLQIIFVLKILLTVLDVEGEVARRRVGGPRQQRRRLLADGAHGVLVWGQRYDLGNIFAGENCDKDGEPQWLSGRAMKGENI